MCVYGCEGRLVSGCVGCVRRRGRTEGGQRARRGSQKSFPRADWRASRRKARNGWRFGAEGRQQRQGYQSPPCSHHALLRRPSFRRHQPDLPSTSSSSSAAAVAAAVGSRCAPSTSSRPCTRLVVVRSSMPPLQVSRHAADEAPAAHGTRQPSDRPSRMTQAPPARCCFAHAATLRPRPVLDNVALQLLRAGMLVAARRPPPLALPTPANVHEPVAADAGILVPLHVAL